MDITSLPQTNGAAGLSAASATDTSKTGVISSDFETFLVMLTAQIQNQDPLNPMDSSDYAVQLATFSGVEQQVLTNQLLESMGGSATGNSLASMASWVGLDALTDGAAAFTGEPLSFSVEIPANASWSKLVIRDASGAEVAAINTALGTRTVTWDGTTSNGTPAQAGLYNAELHVYTGGEGTPDISAVTSYARIVEIRQTASGLQAILENGNMMSVDDITALRSPT